MMIDSYSFGRMDVDGESFTSDLIILPDGIKSSWWRKEGHKLTIDDLQENLHSDIQALVIGTGFLGRMKVDQEIIHYAQTHGIDLIIEKTKTAVSHFNKLSLQKKTAGAFHLTC